MLPKRSVYEEIKKFKIGRTSVKHPQGAERPLASTTTDNNSKQAQQRILADPRVTVDELAYSLQISHGSAH